MIFQVINEFCEEIRNKYTPLGCEERSIGV